METSSESRVSAVCGVPLETLVVLTVRSVSPQPEACFPSQVLLVGDGQAMVSVIRSDAYIQR